MSSFEAHITYTDCNEKEITDLGLRHGFHFSKIDGDEEMGPGVKCYLTCTSTNFNELYRRMVVVCSQSKWVRRKIEAILIDEKKTL